MGKEEESCTDDVKVLKDDVERLISCENKEDFWKTCEVL